MKHVVGAAVLLALAACQGSNPASGNDTEAAPDRPAAAAEHLGAAQALAGVESDSIQPEMMSDVEMATLAETAHRCRFKLTRVAWPSLLYGAGEATIKLNGKLITLPRTAPGRFEDAGLRVTVTPTALPAQGLHQARMIVLPPGTRDERGYLGFAECGA